MQFGFFWALFVDGMYLHCSYRATLKANVMGFFFFLFFDHVTFKQYVYRSSSQNQYPL